MSECTTTYAPTTRDLVEGFAFQSVFSPSSENRSTDPTPGRTEHFNCIRGKTGYTQSINSAAKLPTRRLPSRRGSITVLGRMPEGVVKEEPAPPEPAPPEWPAGAVLKTEESPPEMPAGAVWSNTEQAGVGVVGQVTDAGSRSHGSKRGWVLAGLVVPWVSRALAVARRIFKKQEKVATWTELPAYLAVSKRGKYAGGVGKDHRTRDKIRKRQERAAKRAATAAGHAMAPQ